MNAQTVEEQSVSAESSLLALSVELLDTLQIALSVQIASELLLVDEPLLAHCCKDSDVLG